MTIYRAKPTAAQIAAGYFILPRRLHQEWNGRFPFHEFDVAAFGVEYHRLRLDQNYRVRVRLKEYLVEGDSLTVEVVGPKRLAVQKA